SNLLGESSVEVRAKPRKKKLNNLKDTKPSSSKVKLDEKSEENSKQNKSNFSDFDIKQTGDPHFTDDGFKIISEIPPDDSDISDAFEYDSEDIESPAKVSKKLKNEVQQTEDGFKIISEIPPDDSDIDDAFESDLDEEDWVKDAHTRIKANNTNNNNNLKPVLEKLRKPLLGLIQDFGIEEKIYLNENLKPSLKRSEYNIKNKKRNRKGNPRKTLSDKELQLLDYSSKRGKKKKQVETSPAEEGGKKKMTKEDSEAEFKKTRYEIYKLGISSGSKVEKKEAKIDLVIKLGGKPHKGQVMNYKKLIKLRKEKKEEERLKCEEMREMGMPVKKKPEVKTKPKDEININPGLGTFSGGILRLSKKDIASVNGS
ncbi:hypothetical protein Avbf_16987, partial [Armadillidium vulgare]